MSDLPDGWCEATIADVTGPVVVADPTKMPTKLFKYVDIGSIDNKTQTIANPKIIRGAEAPSRARRVIHADDTLFSTVRTYLKNIALVPEDLDGQLTSTGVTVLRPNAAVHPRYLFIWVCSDRFVEEISVTQDGTMYPAVSDRDVGEGMIRVPPLAEQQRIVTKIDSLSAKSKRACNHLDHIPRLVEKYKQAILAAAFRGDLTKQWRTTNKPGAKDDLRYDIEEGRRSRWLREEQRKQSLRKAKKADVETLRAYRSADLKNIIDGPVDRWCLAQIGSIGFVLGGKRLPKGSVYSASETPFKYLRVTDFADGSIDTTALKYLNAQTSRAIAQYTVESGDVLISIAGTIGATCVIPSELSGANLTENAAKIILSAAVVSRYLDLFLRSDEGQASISASTVATGQPKLALFRIENIAVPIAPTAEQHEIVRLIERAFGWIDRLAFEATSARSLIRNLDQAVLAKAFCGELVPRDSKNEPASVLLKRIRTERSAAGKMTRARGGG